MISNISMIPIRYTYIVNIPGGMTVAAIIMNTNPGKMALVDGKIACSTGIPTMVDTL